MLASNLFAVLGLMTAVDALAAPRDQFEHLKSRFLQGRAVSAEQEAQFSDELMGILTSMAAQMASTTTLSVCAAESTQAEDHAVEAPGPMSVQGGGGFDPAARIADPSSPAADVAASAPAADPPKADFQAYAPPTQPAYTLTSIVVPVASVAVAPTAAMPSKQEMAQPPVAAPVMVTSASGGGPVVPIMHVAAPTTQASNVDMTTSVMEVQTTIVPVTAAVATAASSESASASSSASSSAFSESSGTTSKQFFEATHEQEDTMTETGGASPTRVAEFGVIPTANFTVTRAASSASSAASEVPSSTQSVVAQIAANTSTVASPPARVVLQSPAPPSSTSSGSISSWSAAQSTSTRFDTVSETARPVANPIAHVGTTVHASPQPSAASAASAPAPTPPVADAAMDDCDDFLAAASALASAGNDGLLGGGPPPAAKPASTGPTTFSTKARPAASAQAAEDC